MSREPNHNEAMIHFSRSSHGPGRCGAVGENRYSLHWSQVTCLRCIDKRGNLKEKMLWAGGITASIIVLLIIIITIAAPDSEEEVPVSGPSSWTATEALFAGMESADQLRASGRKFDDEFVQEAMFKVEADVLGDSGGWVVSNSDFSVACDAFQQAEEASSGGDDAMFAVIDETLREKTGLESPALIGVLVGGTNDDTSQIQHLCSPIHAYGVGFIAAFGWGAETYGLDQSESYVSTQLDTVIDGLPRSTFRTDAETVYEQGFFDGMDAATRTFDERGTSKHTEISKIIREDGPFLFSLSNATAGTEVAQQMVAEGTSFDEAFVQEAVYRIKRGDPNDWLIRRADVMTVCEALARMNKEGLEASMEPVFRSFDDGLHPTMLGIIIGADPGWSATAHYCDAAGL